MKVAAVLCSFVFLFVLPSKSAAQTNWKSDWEKLVKTAREEGRLTVYGTTIFEDVFKNFFQKAYPEIKLSFVVGRGAEIAPRLMQERRAGKYIADIYTGATGFAPPRGIKFQRIPENKSLASMLVNHELDAAPVSRAFRPEQNIVDRSTRIRASGGDWSKVKPLFPDKIAEGTRFFNAHGFIPANHTIIIRGDVYKKYPWLPFNLYSALLEAKKLAEETLARRIPQSLVFGPEYLAKTREIFGHDPFPYGVEANRKFLQTTIDFSYEQGLTPSKEQVEDLFAPSTRTV